MEIVTAEARAALETGFRQQYSLRMEEDYAEALKKFDMASDLSASASSAASAAASAPTIELCPYHWEIDSNVDEFIRINCWCLDRQSLPHLVRIEDFRIPVYIELPSTVNHRPQQWDSHSASMFFYDVLCKSVAGYRRRHGGGDQQPVEPPTNFLFKRCEKLYYYKLDPATNEPVKAPMLVVICKSLRVFEALRSVCSNPIMEYGRYGEAPRSYNCVLHEAQISPILKMLAIRNQGYAQWLRLPEGKYSNETECPISTYPNSFEHVVSWQGFVPLDPTETGSWVTLPRVLSIDIETYSDKHRMLPNSSFIAHKPYIVSCIYQQTKRPETRQRYVIVIGECNDIPGAEIIRIDPSLSCPDLRLLEEIASLVRRLDPDIITGFNILGYDLKYLNDRLTTYTTYLDQLGISMTCEWPMMGRLSGSNRQPKAHVMEWSSDAYGKNSMTLLEINGRILIDMLPVVKREYKLDRYDLNTVSMKFLGEGKHDIKAATMFACYEWQEWAVKASNATTLQELFAVGRCPVEDADAARKLVRDERDLFDPVIQQFMEEYGTNKAKYDDDTELTRRVFEAVAKERRDSCEAMTRVVAYCIQDSELVIRLLDKLNVWIGLVELANIVWIPVMDLNTRGQQVRCQAQIYRLASTRQIVMDRFPAPNTPYSGGFVCEPIRGIHDNVICLDFASLYPSIIQAYNICFRTLVPESSMGTVPDDQCNVFDFEEEIDPSVVPASEFGDGESSAGPASRPPIAVAEPDGFEDENPEETTGRPAVVRSLADIRPGAQQQRPAESSAGMAYFVKNHYKFVKPSVRAGLLPELVRRLVEERRKVRKQLAALQKKAGAAADDDDEDSFADRVLAEVLDKRQLALKVTANSFYGFLGVPNGRLPLIEAAKCITGKGRELINHVKTYVTKKYNATVVYGDTDSSMIDLKLTDPAECDVWGHRLAAEISGTDDTPGLFPPPLKMEYEKAMRIVCLKKKKYLAFFISKGQVKRSREGMLMKGVVVARRDNCAYLRDSYIETAYRVLSRDPMQQTFEYVFDSAFRLIKGQDLDWTKFVVVRSYSGTYKSPGYFMRVFGDQLRARGNPVLPGERLDYVVVRTENPDLPLGHRMRLVSHYKEAIAAGTAEPIDVGYYMEKSLMNPLDQLFSTGYIKQLDDLPQCGYQPLLGKFYSLAYPIRVLVRMLRDGIDPDQIYRFCLNAMQAISMPRPVTSVASDANGASSAAAAAAPEPSEERPQKKKRQATVVEMFAGAAGKK